MDDTAEAEDTKDDVCLPGNVAEGRGDEVGKGKVEDLVVSKCQ